MNTKLAFYLADPAATFTYHTWVNCVCDEIVKATLLADGWKWELCN